MQCNQQALVLYHLKICLLMLKVEQPVTVLFTQASATTGGVGNTTFDVGLGTDCTIPL